MESYEKIKAQRTKLTAPVDYYGCNSINNVDYNTKKLSVLVLLLLSSQTRDDVTYKAVMDFLKTGKFNIESIDQMDVEEVNEIIKKVGYHNKKSVYLKQIIKIIKSDGFPKSLSDTIKLPGIGHKMGILYMLYACNEVVGISVDTHVHRIVNRIGLVNTKTPEKSMKQLELIFNEDEWGHVNKTLVGFGQEICKPKNPNCKICDARNVCPSSKF